ncbi:Lysine-specific demethylase 8 [Smittium mucronatum]|uniref:Lysine-specific demethylase 8 n=1 Tax=Smittium mucronatum TaxID=133383 RepID=A0A1R0H2U1_9FUNG|nr:Lysine-specific demethylase 8 [Smittium mucronatum]
MESCFSKEIHNIFLHFHNSDTFNSKRSSSPTTPSHELQSLSTKYPTITRHVKRFSEPISLVKFKKLIDNPDCEPFIIQNSINHWPSVQPDSPNSWSNVEYLRNTVGQYRLVPIEIGSSYSDSEWSQKLLYFGEYIDDYIIGNKKPTAYLAQYDLLNQSTKLELDLGVPDYCLVDSKCFSSPQPHYSTLNPDPARTGSDCNHNSNCCGNTKLIKNIWFGPKNVTSPLHFDSFHNLYAMVSGHKYVKLVSHKYTDKVYPFPPDSLLSNTSQVDAEFPDPVKFPEFVSVPYFESILSPGDLLYIPVSY